MSLAVPSSLRLSSLSATDRARVLKGGFVLAVVLAHVGAGLLLSQPNPDERLPELPAIQVELVRLEMPPPPPPPPQPPSPESGGGRPAAPSRIHITPPPPKEVPRELPAPIVQAPEPDPVVVGASDTRSPAPGFGQGGEGTGTGTGRGLGAGPGSGQRTGPRNLRRPSSAELRRYHPQEALRQRISGAVVVLCRIGQDTRLIGCRIVRETPEGYGFGEAALRAAQETYRFRPATRDGAYDDAVTVTIDVLFGPRGGPQG